jgi:predicted DNA-binding transcriptional regulator AlpA
MLSSREPYSPSNSPATSPYPLAEKRVKALATTRPWTLIGVGRSTWYRLLSQGRAPVGIRVTRKKRIWSIAELQRWLDREAENELQDESRRGALSAAGRTQSS